MNFLTDHAEALVSIVLGASAIFWPLPKQAGQERQRQKRLAELNTGAEESFFEERRQLEAYGPKSGGPFRLLGIVVLLFGVIAFFL